MRACIYVGLHTYNNYIGLRILSKVVLGCITTISGSKIFNSQAIYRGNMTHKKTSYSSRDTSRENTRGEVGLHVHEQPVSTRWKETKRLTCTQGGNKN